MSAIHDLLRGLPRSQVTLFALFLGVAAPLSVRAADRGLITSADLFTEENVRDAALSPSGRYLATVVRRETNDVVLLEDLQTSSRTVPTSIEHHEGGADFDNRLINVYWKGDERLLIRVRSQPSEDANVAKLVRKNLAKLGDRLFAINRDGTQVVRLLKSVDVIAGLGAIDLGDICDMLPNDPTHVLMVVRGLAGASLIRVDTHTGTSEVIESPAPNLVAWWLDLNGVPVVRVTSARGELRYSSKQAGGEWKVFHTTRLREMREQVDYAAIGASDQAGKYFVLAQPPGHDRVGVYLYDLANGQFGEPLAENAQFDINAARVSRDGKKLLHYCYVANVSVCEFADATTEAHMKGLRRYFQESANVFVTDASEDGKTILVFVKGPSVAPSYFYYRVDAKRIEFVGLERNSLADKRLPTAATVRWKTRDGRDLSGYLTKPPGAAETSHLPLVVYPHGGPERRDRLDFDAYVQFFAARGYAVFQPNFRGSAGFGKEFASSGYGEWGRKMQDDVTDGLRALIDQGLVDPARVCIVGASYGGYAALAGITLTPDLYKCAVAMSGPSDLPAFMRWYQSEYGGDSKGADYWRRAIGDPSNSKERMREVSPVNLAKSVKADVLLIHGDRDYVVPIAQSRAMKKALDRAGRKTTLIELEDEGHSFWTDADEMRTLRAIDVHLWKNLGPGFGVTNPPEETTHAN